MKKLFIDVDKIREAVKDYETVDKMVTLTGVVCEVMPKQGNKQFSDEFGYGKFLLPINNFVTEIELPEEETAA